MRKVLSQTSGRDLEEEPRKCLVRAVNFHNVILPDVREVFGTKCNFLSGVVLRLRLLMED
jgi:hypothetical protein